MKMKKLLYLILFISIGLYLFAQNKLAPPSPFTKSFKTQVYYGFMKSYRSISRKLFEELFKQDESTKEGRKDNKAVEQLSLAYSDDEEIFKDNKPCSVLYHIFNEKELFDASISSKGLSFEFYKNYMKEQRNIEVSENHLNGLKGNFLLYDETTESYKCDYSSLGWDLFTRFKRDFLVNGKAFLKQMTQEAPEISTYYLSILLNTLKNKEKDLLDQAEPMLSFYLAEGEKKNKHIQLGKAFVARTFSLHFQDSLAKMFYKDQRYLEVDFNRLVQEMPSSFQPIFRAYGKRTVDLLRKVSEAKEKLRSLGDDRFDAYFDSIIDVCKTISIGSEYTEIEEALDGILLSVKERIKTGWDSDVLREESKPSDGGVKIFLDTLKARNRSSTKKLHENLNVSEHLGELKALLESKSTRIDFAGANEFQAFNNVILSGVFNGSPAKLIIKFREKEGGSFDIQCALGKDTEMEQRLERKSTVRITCVALDDFMETVADVSTQESLRDLIIKFIQSKRFNDREEEREKAKKYRLYSPTLRDPVAESNFLNCLRKPLWAHFFSKCKSIYHKVDTYNIYEIFPSDKHLSKQGSFNGEYHYIVGQFRAFLHEFAHAFYEFSSDQVTAKINEHFKFLGADFFGFGDKVNNIVGRIQGFFQGLIQKFPEYGTEERIEHLPNEAFAFHVDNIIRERSIDSNGAFRVEETGFPIQPESLNFLQSIGVLPKVGEVDFTGNNGAQSYLRALNDKKTDWITMSFDHIALRIEEMGQYIPRLEGSMGDLSSLIRYAEEIKEDFIALKDLIREKVSDQVELKDSDDGGFEGTDLPLLESDRVAVASSLDRISQKLDKFHLRSLKRNVLYFDSLLTRQLPLDGAKSYNEQFSHVGLLQEKDSIDRSA